MPIQVKLNELEAPPPAPAPAPQQVPSWAQPSNRTERRCVATNDVTVRRAAALDSEVVGELRAGDHCTVDGQQSISRQGRVVEMYEAVDEVRAGVGVEAIVLVHGKGRAALGRLAVENGVVPPCLILSTKAANRGAR